MADNLTIQPFAHAVTTLRKRIEAEVANATAEFEQATGVTPSRVDIDMHETSTINSIRTFAVGRVPLEFKV